MHGAAFATPQIVAEVILAAALLFSASRWPNAGQETD
jgi:hypothetical protein